MRGGFSRGTLFYSVARNYGCVSSPGGDADIERRRRRCTGFDSGILVQQFQDGEGLDLMLMDHSSEQELITFEDRGAQP